MAPAGTVSRVTRAEWYRRVNASWPEAVPALSEDEAVRAARKLYRFVTKKTWSGEVVVRPHGGPWGRQWRAFSYTRDAKGRRAIAVYPEAGWKDLVHLMSHYLESYAGTHGHNATHARLEMRMIREVVRRGWLDGKLRGPEKPAVAAPDKLSVRRQRTAAAIARWEAKERRAANALKKLRRRLAYYDRPHPPQGQPTEG